MRKDSVGKMKMLDEVIKAFEYCISDDINIDNCFGCPYDKEEEGCHQRNFDALHYLREYRERLKGDDNDNLERH